MEVSGKEMSWEEDEMSEGSAEARGQGEEDVGGAEQSELSVALAAAGPVGVAAAAAINSSKAARAAFTFETNPSVRKRQANRLLRKLRATIDEFSTRVGIQAVCVVTTPGKKLNNFKVFGAKPLERVVRDMQFMIMEELEAALAVQAPPPIQDDPSLYELPPIVIDGIPTPVEEMTQAQLRAFIPLMLKYSTGRGKPGWSRESTRPPWWPTDLPWANVRMDARPEDEKQKISWTHALRQIVINCYKFHGREDLLPQFKGHDPLASKTETMIVSGGGEVECSEEAGSGGGGGGGSGGGSGTEYLLQTIVNPDGSLSVVQLEPAHPLLTLAQAGGQPASTETTLNTDGQQLILSSHDGQDYPMAVSEMIAVPMSQAMYLQNTDGTIQVVIKSEPQEQRM